MTQLSNQARRFSPDGPRNAIPVCVGEGASATKLPQDAPDHLATPRCSVIRKPPFLPLVQAVQPRTRPNWRRDETEAASRALRDHE